MQLSIIIVNYNVKYFLEHCLLSVIKACKEIDAEIFVVDNYSTDGSETYLSHKFPTVKFFWNKTNPGFGKANNSVLKDAKGDYILFLNPDTIVPEDCFTKCISFFENNSDCGALGVRMIDGSGRFLKESKRCLPSPSSGFFKMIGLESLFPNSPFFAKYYAGHLPEKENNKVEVLAGAFMMLRKKTIEITNGFDEAFFMYGEDIDLSFRILKAGFQNYYLGETIIIHFKGESTQKKSAGYILHFYGAMKLFINKHYSHSPLLKFCMNGMINNAQIFEKIKSSFNISKNNTTAIQPLNIFFNGTLLQLENVKNILENSNHNITQTSILENNNIPKYLLPITTGNSNAILFCEGVISNGLIIENMSLIPKKECILIYESGAQSIIGSSNKNEKGIFISGQQ